MTVRIDAPKFCIVLECCDGVDHVLQNKGVRGRYKFFFNDPCIRTFAVNSKAAFENDERMIEVVKMPR